MASASATGIACLAAARAGGGVPDRQQRSGQVEAARGRVGGLIAYLRKPFSESQIRREIERQGRS